MSLNQSPKIARLICKKCGKIFIPLTYRESVTGTCSDDDCYVSFSDTDDKEHVQADLYKYSFNCLKCDEKIFTNEISDRLCSKCREKNKRTRIFYSKL
ncbi:MAG: hypothetical protein ABIA04_06735 [Pseudomonadota bacterium]